MNIKAKDGGDKTVRAMDIVWALSNTRYVAMMNDIAAIIQYMGNCR